MAGALITLFALLSIALWPSSSDKALQQTTFTIAVPETEPEVPPEPELNWEETSVKAGDSLSSLFSRNNLSAVDVIALASVAPKGSLQLKPGQTLHWVRSADNHVQNFQIELSPLARHSFERNAEGAMKYHLEERHADYRPRYASAVINNSLFVDGTQAGVPEQVLIELAGIFGWDIDFALDIREGDSFSLIYDEVYLDGDKIGNGNILIARFNNQGRELTAVRYEYKNGDASYYTPDGQSMRKEFLRNPIDFARISSRFNLSRKHPVLNTIRAHKGTDYAAAVGTPIKAAGDGKIIFAGRKGGYGNCVIIQHGSRYQTLYAHMSKFGKNARTGRAVKQGQIIGYVGSTGLATGPHLHYEFRVDGVHRDSLRVKLPKAEAVPDSEKASFREKSDSMLSWLNSFADGEGNRVGSFQ
ncbi:peptidoglycan DD-metalloendopeptidase family protein [Thalassolituus sp. LLYu03]|uniref:peptidoglycan DD-metalloendopeptidase family protein n=1 Tax=Thalassolituus sp. LLYu03 TaxID=3421656 RepID=UPI003D287873